MDIARAMFLSLFTSLIYFLYNDAMGVAPTKWVRRDTLASSYDNSCIHEMPDSLGVVKPRKWFQMELVRSIIQG